jgi:hypothetical protein
MVAARRSGSVDAAAMKTLLRRLPTPERSGAVVVEAALVLPLFFLIVLGIVEFGRAMMVGQVLTAAARHGSRRAIVDGSSNAAVAADVQTYLQNALGVNPADVAVTIQVTAHPGNPTPVVDLSAALPKDLCEIDVRVPYNKVGFIAGRFLSAAQLRGECSMRHE